MGPREGQPTRRRTVMITLRGGSGPVITRSCDWLACTHVVGPRAMPTWSMVPSQSPSRNTRSPALIGSLQKSTARPRRACDAAWWISDTPTREYAAIVSPEQSNAPGPAVKNTYGLPTCAKANEIAAAAGPDGADAPVPADAWRDAAAPAGSDSRMPGMIRLVERIPLTWSSDDRLTPWAVAMPNSVSPAATV